MVKARRPAPRQAQPQENPRQSGPCLRSPPSLEAYQAELARLKSLVPVLMEASFPAGSETVRFAMFDTRNAGGIYIELLWNYRA